MFFGTGHDIKLLLNTVKCCSVQSVTDCTYINELTEVKKQTKHDQSVHVDKVDRTAGNENKYMKN